MENWYSILRKLKDDSEIPFKTEELATKIYHDLKRFKIREKNKFKQRMGPEFESWVLALKDRFVEDAVQELLSDDEFWEATLKVTLGI